MSMSCRTFGICRHSMAMWLLTLACVGLSTVPASGRTLNAWDAWPSAARCPGLPTASSAKDGSGRLWGFANGGSCAFKDEQQQALYPNIATPKQDWSTAPVCGEAPSGFNSAPDSLNRLWGVWWSKSCAFRTASGEPIYYTGYAGAKYSQPKPSPSPSPSPSPKPVPRPASPSPIPTAQPTVPAPVPTPAPAPATAGGTPCTSQPATIMLNSSAVAEAVVAKLWEKFSYGTNGYEISGLKASEAPATKGSKVADDVVDPFAKLATAMAIILQQRTADTSSPATVQDVPAKQMLDSSNATNTASMTAAESTNTTDSLLPVRPDGPNRTYDNNATQTRRHMLASLTKQPGVAELTHPVQPQGLNMPKTNSRHVLQESMSDKSTQLTGQAAVPEAAPVSPSLPEDSDITILVPIQPPPGPRSSTTTNDASSSDKPAATWEAAPACSQAPNANNTSKDDVGRLWGWESDASCAFKDAAGVPVFTFELAPVCKSVVATTRDEQGRLWGWEDGMSCKLQHIVSP